MGQGIRSQHHFWEQSWLWESRRPQTAAVDSLYCWPLPASLAAGLSACSRFTVSTATIYSGKFTALLRWKQRSPPPLLCLLQTQKPWGCLTLPPAPSSVAAGLAPAAPSSARQSHPCSQANPCATLPELGTSAAPAVPAHSMVLVATEPMLPLFLPLREQAQQHPPHSPGGTRASQHHATLGRKRPRTVRITFFPPSATSRSLTPELGTPGSPSLGPWARRARVSWRRLQRAGPSPAAKG